MDCERNTEDMTQLKTHTFKHKDVYAVLQHAIAEVSNYGLKHKDNKNLLYAVAFVVQKLEIEADKTEELIKTEDKDFYSLS